eukprot:CAMPEP_0183748338 /NCGR_PEP_ID=MMETSP0737-20130205/67719_1 /TAXON_ID=385413 /ORGANISM="Thalassiosira miniscula, Strain CCMP1093" /LENGTH=721 /DNA_ID=CAMNT_0025984059 /DNA_START=752 /DNA_END=2917 /DNA_ORIENTATION=+
MTASPPPPPHNNRERASSDCYTDIDPHKLQLDLDYSLQRAASSDAQLQLAGQYSGLSSMSISSNEDSIHDNGGSNNPQNEIHNSPTPRSNNSTAVGRQHHSFSFSAKSQQQRTTSQEPLARAKSDSAHSNTSGGRRLQTIESGIALADAASAPQQEYSVPTYSPPKPTGGGPFHHSMTNQQHQQQPSPQGSPTRGGSSPLLPPLHPMPTIDYNGSGPSRPDPQRSRLQSDNSYYSVDAGKHGFLNPHPVDHYNRNQNDNDSVGGDSANDSLVFKYLPGQETPPAEYALPATILSVYGEEAPAHHHNASTGNGNGIQWHHENRPSYCGSQSSIVFDDVESGVRPRDNDESTNEARNDNDTKKGTSPPDHPSSLRIPHLMASPDSDDLSPRRSLPYPERKRLMELEEEEKKRKKNAKVQQQQQQQQQQKPSKSRTNKRSTKGRGSGSPRKDGETTPLTSRKHGSSGSGASSGYGTRNTTASTKTSSDQTTTSPPKQNNGIFGQLIAIVTGKSSDETKQQFEEDPEKVAQTYRDRGRAFLQKTERERQKMKEQNRLDELNNVTVPVTKQSFGGHRSKMSSLTTALHSIASCSDDDESSSDEESGSSYYFDRETPTATTARVWKYGEPPNTNPHHPNKTPTKNKSTTPRKKKKNKTSSSSSKHDQIMKRERLMQEEYEYRLHLLKNENEKLSKKFRVFVLVTVAFIFAGALAFALVVCVRMLMSI